MRDLDEVCAGIVSRVDDACAAAIVLLDSGAVVGAHGTAGDVDAQGMAAVARNAAAPLAHGLHKDGDSPPFDEIYLSTPDHSHFAKVVRGGRGLLVVATRRLSNVGMGWTQVRGCAPLVDSLDF